MTKLVHFLLVSLLLLSISTGCEKNNIEPEERTAERTVLVYFAADNNLSSFARKDAIELEAGIAEFDGKNYRLLVYIDTGSQPQLYRLKKNNKGEVEKEIIQSYESQDSTDPKVMKAIFSEVFTKYPANDYGLILWSHADGWLESPTTRWFGQDGNNFMNISELKEVLRNAPHFEYIYFESCYMAAVEVLYELRSFADYFIASPMETPGPGAPYDLIFEAMFDKTNPAVQIGEIYFEHYKEKYRAGAGLTNDNWTAGASLAVIDSDALEELAVATRKILPEYMPDGEINRKNIPYYDTRSSKYYYYDMDGLMQSLTGKNEDYLEWKTVYDKVMVYYNTTPLNYSMHINGMHSMDGSTGLSSYIPRSAQANLLPYYRTYEWYKAGGWNETGW